MKILITTDWYAPTVNGVVTSVLNLRKELLKKGHEVKILTLSNTPRSYINNDVYAIGSIPVSLIYPNARLRTSPSFALIEELLEWRPDIVHSNCEFSTFFPARHIARRLHIPLVHTYHTVYEDYTHYFSPSAVWGSRLVAAFTRYISGEVDCVAAPTRKVYRLLQDYDVKCPVHVLPSGIDMDKYAGSLPPEEALALREKYNIPKKNKIALYVGRLAKEKNLSELLAFWKNGNYRNMTFLIAGDGPYMGEIRREIQTLGISNSVRMCGMVAPEEIPKYYKTADIFLNASASETQGLTYIEALASGLPILCRADSCLEDVLLPGKNGWQYRTEEEFHMFLKEFMANADAEKFSRQTISETVEKYSDVHFAEEAIALYTRVSETLKPDLTNIEYNL